MATEILMPRQGNTVESCLIIEWRKQEGDAVRAGDVLCEVETDKATFEVESEVDGTLLKVLYGAEADVPVLQTIALVGQSGEDISAFVAQEEATTPTEAPQIDVAAEIAAPPIQTPTAQPASASGAGISPRARNLAAAKGVNISQLSGSGPQGRIIERDVQAALSGQPPVTPAAIAALIEQGAQVPVAGSGIGERVTMADLTQAEPLAATIQTSVEFPGAITEIPVKGVRKVIASRMLESLQTTAQVTISASADATQLLAYRKRLKASPEEFGVSGITINDLVLYAVAKTLPQFPFMNAHFLGDTINEFERVHLGVAIDTAKGLMVPPVKNADGLSLKALAQESKRLALACQEGNIQPDELVGATFTITNLGALGIESFTPVLNPPEVGILGVCAIQPKPVMRGEEVTFVPHIGLSLTFNHQAVDGAPAARFLKALSTALANFDLLLAG